MSDNLTTIKAAIDAAIDPALGVGGILAVNHNTVLSDTLFKAGKRAGIYYTASGDLTGVAPSGFFLWNGNDPSQLTTFTIRLAELTADLNDVGDALGLLNPDDLIFFKDTEGRSFWLKYQSHIAGVDGSANNIYDVDVQGVASNSNFVYPPTLTSVCALGFLAAGGGGGGGVVVSLQDGQGIVIDNTDPANPIVDWGGTIDEFVNINIDGSTTGFAELDFSLLDFVGNSGLWQLSAAQHNWYLEDSAGTSRTDQLSNPGYWKINVLDNNGGDDKQIDLDLGDLQPGILMRVIDASTNDQTRIELESNVMRVITPNVHAGTAVTGQYLQLINDLTGEVEFANVTGVNTIYSADDSLAAARAVDLNGNELTFTEGANIIYFNNGRIGVQTPVFGGSRLGDSVLQAPSIDLQTLNFKDAGQLTALSMFFTKVPGVGVDGYVTTLKNFVDDVNVLSVAGLGAETFGAVGRQVESTIGLRNDFSGGEFRVFDTFNNDYDAPTDVAEAQGWVAIHGGGATKKKIGLWRYDGVTYDNMWQISGGGDVLTLSKQTDVSGILRAFTGIRIQNGGVSNSIQMEDAGASSYAVPARNYIFWDNNKFSLQPQSLNSISGQFDLTGLTAIRQFVFRDEDLDLGGLLHDDVANEINAIPVKATPVGADVIVIEDSAAGFAKKSALISSLPGGGGGISYTTGSEVSTFFLAGGTLFQSIGASGTLRWREDGTIGYLQVAITGCVLGNSLTGVAEAFISASSGRAPARLGQALAISFATPPPVSKGLISFIRCEITTSGGINIAIQASNLATAVSETTNYTIYIQGTYQLT